MPDTPQPVVHLSSRHPPELPSHTANIELSTPGDQTAPTLPPPVTPSPTIMLNPTVGTMVDQYRLDEKLGEGGMGAVWMAFHVKLKKHVAYSTLSEPEPCGPSFCSWELHRFVESMHRPAAPCGHTVICRAVVT